MTNPITEAVARHLEELLYPVEIGDKRAEAYRLRHARKLAQAAISAHLKALEEAGYVVVPREPTEAMIDAAVTVPSARNLGERVISQWQAMIQRAKGE